MEYAVGIYRMGRLGFSQIMSLEEGLAIENAVQGPGLYVEVEEFEPYRGQYDDDGRQD